MKKTLLGIVALCGLLVLGLAGRVLANSAVDGDVPAIMASPQVIIPAKVSQLTIHTNIPASTVMFGTVALNGVAAENLGVDSCGHLVARFDLADLSLVPGVMQLELTGLFVDGTPFAATTEVTVR